MNNRSKLLGKSPSLIFSALFLLYGYNCISNFIYYSSKRSVWVSDSPWTDVFLTAVMAICFIILAVGCFTQKTGLQKAGLGLLAFITLCSIIDTSNVLEVNRVQSVYRTPQFTSYCVTLARLAYALLLLMAIRIPAKSQLLGITAASVYTVSFVYLLLARRATPSVFGILNLVLLGSGAVAFGLLPHMQDQISENFAEEVSQKTGVWVCPECGSENNISRVSCSECGRQRN